MAAPVTPRTAWLDAGFRALAEGGPAALRIEALARALGVSKGGFYWYFRDRASYVNELLETWERTGVDDVMQLVESEGGDARTRLRHLSDLAGRHREILRTDLAMRDWARRDRGVARRLRRVDDRRMDYLRSLYAAICDDPDEIEVRSFLTFSLWIGNHFIAASHAGRARRDVIAAALNHLER